MRWYITDYDLCLDDATGELCRRLLATGRWRYDPLWQVWVLKERP